MDLAARKKILIVDDDPDIQATLKKRLNSQGFECSTANTISTGLKKLNDEAPDLVILDLGFPGPNGTAFLQNAKNYLPAERGIPPILVLSCYKDKEIVDLVLSEGAVGFVPKPYDSSALISTIRAFLDS